MNRGDQWHEGRESIKNMSEWKSSTHPFAFCLTRKIDNCLFVLDALFIIEEMNLSLSVEY
jgi:hypothetical protein